MIFFLLSRGFGGTEIGQHGNSPNQATVVVVWNFY